MSVDLIYWTAAQNIKKELILYFLDKAAAEFNLESDAIQIKIDSIVVKYIDTFDAARIKTLFYDTLRTLVNPTINVFAATTVETFINKDQIITLKDLLIYLIQIHKGSRHSLLLLRAEPWPRTKFLSSGGNALLTLGHDLFDNWIRKAILACRETENSQFFGIGFLDRTPVVPFTDLGLIFDHEKNQQPSYTKFAYFHFLRCVIFASAITAKRNCFTGTGHSVPNLLQIPFFDEKSKPIFLIKIEKHKKAETKRGKNSMKRGCRAISKIK